MLLLNLQHRSEICKTLIAQEDMMRVWGCLHVYVCVMKPHRAVARWGSQVSGCDCDVIEGCCLSVQLDVLPHPKLALHWRNHELI